MRLLVRRCLAMVSSVHLWMLGQGGKIRQKLWKTNFDPKWEHSHR